MFSTTNINTNTNMSSIKSLMKVYEYLIKIKNSMLKNTIMQK